MERLESEELRVLPPLCLAHGSGAERVDLAYLQLIARAAGRAGRVAREVKVADLQDRCAHPRVRSDGWSPPCARDLATLRVRPPASAAHAARVT